MSRQPYTLDRIFRFLITLVIGAGLVWLVDYVAAVLLPFAVAVLLAYLLDPLVTRVQRWAPHRLAAVVLTLIAIGLLVALVGGLMAPLVADEFESAVRLILDGLKDGSPLRRRFAEIFSPELIAALGDWLHDKDVQQFLRHNSQLQDMAVTVLRRAVPQIWGLVSGAMAIVGLLMQGLLVVVYLVFLLVDFRLFESTWKDYLPPKSREAVTTFLHEFNLAMSRYFRAQFWVAMLVGVIFAIGFSIVGIKLAILLGLFIGALNMVPYLQLVGAAPAVLMTMLTAADGGGSFWWLLAGVAGVFLVAQLLQDVVIAPRIMGAAMGLRPVLILFSVFFWGKLLGFLGLLLAIPLTCLGLAYYQRLLSVESLTPQAATTSES